MAKKPKQIKPYRVTLRKRQAGTDEPATAIVPATDAYVDSRGALIFQIGQTTSYGVPCNVVAAFAPGSWVQFSLTTYDEDPAST